MMKTRTKIDLILPDRVVQFGHNNIYSASLVEEFSEVGTELPISKLEFRAIISEELSMFTDQSILVERLPLVVYELLENEFVFLGRYYLDNWKNNSERQIEFTAVDLIGLLSATDFDGRFWETPITLQSALAQVLLPIAAPFTIVGDIGTRLISGWIPPGDYRTALQQILFAARATVVTARGDKLEIREADIPYRRRDLILSKEGRSDKETIELLPVVSQIELVSHNYTQGNQLETIFDKTLDAGNHKIVFEKPYHSIVIDGAGYEPSVLGTEGGDYVGTENEDYIEVGGEFVFGPNSVYLTLSEESHVVITGYPWIDSKRSFIHRKSGVTTRYQNTMLISDATMVSAVNAQDVLDLLIEFYDLRYKQIVTLFPNRVRAGDKVLTYTLYDRRVLGGVKRIESNLTGGYLMRTEIIGLDAVYVPPMETPYRRHRTGIAVTGADLTRNNRWRRYA